MEFWDSGLAVKGASSLGSRLNKSRGIVDGKRLKYAESVEEESWDALIGRYVAEVGSSQGHGHSRSKVSRAAVAIVLILRHRRIT